MGRKGFFWSSEYCLIFTRVTPDDKIGGFPVTVDPVFFSPYTGYPAKISSRRISGNNQILTFYSILTIGGSKLYLIFLPPELLT